MTTRKLIKYESLQAVLAASAAAASEALATVGVSPNHLSFEAGVLPSSTGAGFGTLGAYYTLSGHWQRVRWNGTEWEDNGDPILTSGASVLDNGGAGVNVRNNSVGAEGDGTTSDSEAFSALTPGRHYIVGPGTYLIDEDTTIPSGVVLDFSRGAQISVPAGVTLTLNAEVLAGRYPIFTGDGSVLGFSGTSTFYPEWWGAVGDGVTGCYYAWQSLIEAVNSRGGGVVECAPGATYWIETYRTAENGLAPLHFLSCTGLTIRGNEAKLDFNGAFHMDAVTTRTMAFLFQDCHRLRIERLEVDGNNEVTTKDGAAVPDAPGESNGIQLRGCTYWTVEDVYTHHWISDGVYISDYYDEVTRTACKHGTLRRVRSEYNARQGMSVIQWRHGLVEDCQFNYTGRSPFGYFSPGANIDIEPNRVVAEGMDVATGMLVFNRVSTNDARSFELVARNPDRHDNIKFIDCHFDVGLTGGGGVDSRGVEFHDSEGSFDRCIFQMRDCALRIKSSVGQRVIYRECTVYSYFRAVESDSSQWVRFERCRFIGTHTSPALTEFMYVLNILAEFEDCTVFVPAAAKSTANLYHDMVRWRVGKSYRTQFKTDLSPAGGAHFNLLNLADVEASYHVHVDDKVQTDNAFRIGRNSTWDPARPFSYGHKTTVGYVTYGMAIRTTSVWNPPSLPTGSQQMTTVSVPGAVTGDILQFAFNLDLQGTSMWAYVSAPDVVTVVHRNDTGVTVDLTAGTFRIGILRAT